jgi:hypothetical protein
MENKNLHKYNKHMKYYQIHKEKIIMIKIEIMEIMEKIIIIIMQIRVMPDMIQDISIMIIKNHKVKEITRRVIIIEHINIKIRMDMDFISIENIRVIIIRIFFTILIIVNLNNRTDKIILMLVERSISIHRKNGNLTKNNKNVVNNMSKSKTTLNKLDNKNR